MTQASATRKSRLAICEEVSGPVSPTSGYDYLALQPGYSVKPNTDKIANNELKAGLDSSKDALGAENPEFTVSHYPYGSGVIGQPPETSLLLKGAFGDEVIASTEYNIVAVTAGSATVPATITVGAGEGAFFERGQALMIKFPAGYEVRNVESVAGDVLTLSFNLSSTVGLVGTGLGKAILYKPADDDVLPALSIWDYRANGAAIQLVSGGRVTEFSMDAKAAAEINASYTVKGIEMMFNPIEITATADTIDFTGDAGLKTATLANKFYKDPHEAAAALAAAMTSVAGGQTISVSYVDATGKFDVSATGAVFAPKWLTTATSLGAKFGFTADDTGSLSYTSDVALDLSSPQQPILDGQDLPIAKSNKVMFGSFYNSSCYPANELAFKQSNEIVDVKEFCADSGISGKEASGRKISVDVTVVMPSYNAQEYHRYHANQSVRFSYTFGPKSGNSLIEGKTGSLYVSNATISAFSIDDQDGFAVIKMTLAGYSVSGESVAYLNYL